LNDFEKLAVIKFQEKRVIGVHRLWKKNRKAKKIENKVTWKHNL
jgi:hypothetical protein